MPEENKKLQVLVHLHPVPICVHNVYGDYDAFLAIHVRKWPDGVGAVPASVYVLVSTSNKVQPAILTESQVNGIARTILTKGSDEFAENFVLPERIKLPE